MAYPNSFGYDPFYRPNPPFHLPTSPLNLHDYVQSIIPSFTSYPLLWCHHCHNSSHPSEQCPSIGYSLGLGQNQFNSIFQEPTSEPCQSDFNSGCWNYSYPPWDQSYTNSESNWSYTQPSPS